MKMHIPLISAVLLCSAQVLAEEPMSVEDALNYQLPANPCVEAEVIADGTNSANAGGTPFLEGNSSTNISDTDYYERERQGRKEKRWKKCLAEYKEGLLVDMERLKSSAAHGLTQEQAYAIVAHMKLIQDTYLSPNGMPPAAEAQ